MLRIELDTVRKYRTKQEYRQINRATCGELSVEGDGWNIHKLCQLLAENNPRNTVVEVYRGGTLCFTPEALEKWASGKFGKGDQPEHLRKEA